MIFRKLSEIKQSLIFWIAQSKNLWFCSKDMQWKRHRLMKEDWEVDFRQNWDLFIEESSIRLNMQYSFMNEQNRTKHHETILKHEQQGIDWIREVCGSLSWGNEQKQILSWRELWKDEKNRLMKSSQKKLTNSLMNNSNKDDKNSRREKCYQRKTWFSYMRRQSFCWMLQYIHSRRLLIPFCNVWTCWTSISIWRHSSQLQRFYLQHCDCSRDESNLKSWGNGYRSQLFPTDDWCVWYWFHSLMSSSASWCNSRKFWRNGSRKMTLFIFIKWIALQSFSSYIKY